MRGTSTFRTLCLYVSSVRGALSAFESRNRSPRSRIRVSRFTSVAVPAWIVVSACLSAASAFARDRANRSTWRSFPSSNRYRVRARHLPTPT